MSGWRLKRFWAEATVEPAEGGWTLRLDGRALRTPGRAAFVVPTRRFAEAVAAEWAAQEGEVRPETMPFTRTANSAIDKLAGDGPLVAEDLAGYGASDLLCYRAEAPAGLAARQAAAWDPVLLWAETALGAPLVVTRGVMPCPQPEASLARLSARVLALDPFRLAAFHDLVVLSGSLLLALAVLDGHLDAPEAWRRSRIDEEWQQEHWGEDDEASRQAAVRARAFQEAAEVIGMLREPIA